MLRAYSIRHNLKHWGYKSEQSIVETPKEKEQSGRTKQKGPDHQFNGELGRMRDAAGG